jgi:hypothetical protein
MLTLRSQQPSKDVSSVSPETRPVLLATLEVGFDPVAAEFAVDAAVEAGQPLIVANVVEMPLGPMCVLMGYGALDPADDDAARLRAPAELAHSLGVPVERLRVRSPHPLDALLELVAERAPGLLVFGPDRVRLKPRLYRRAVKKIRAGVGCLIWLPE